MPSSRLWRVLLALLLLAALFCVPSLVLTGSEWPVKLRQKGSLWYLWEYSSILSGIRSLAECDPWG